MDAAKAPPQSSQTDIAVNNVAAVTADGTTLVGLTVAALHHRCAENRHLESAHQTRFHSSRTPQISMWDYIRRISKYSGCSPECFIIAVILMDRYLEASHVALTFRNVHRLTITAVMLAAKIRDDTYYSNAYYASIGGVTNAEINMLELELLCSISWRTWVEPTEFYNSVTELAQRFHGSVAGAAAAAVPPAVAVA
mmetsp:Transcript_81947/g.95733  ORF Transcript_81947/g.95733 Transcript_81947/m.95733 type:complete len:196 (-) Transcript_81947:238-825(-)